MLLHERYPAVREGLPHLSLSDGPTPVRRLDGLSADGRAEVWVKDDGAFGSGPWGGNKVRKLEWLLPEARRRGRTILTFGGLGTNWGLATALYGRDHGVRTALALVDQPVDEHVSAQLERLRASGATLHFTRTKRRTVLALPWLIARHRPYLVPAGGSSPLGMLGYVDASLELAAQVAAGELPEPSHAVVAIGSSGSAAGLALGLRLAGLGTRVVGVPVTRDLRADPASVARLAGRAAKLLRSRGARLEAPPPTAADVTILDGWIGAGYGHPTPEGEAAAAAARERDALALDPVYTAKAVAALRAANAAGELGRGTVLYVHTDGPRY
ncbi:MAG: pyridoxal-phosphate dependent enzyme [Thermoleophilaceae bacterium]|nr:pyridoxal-phosphate dependent enzyme [Thermoleophilaceae bacterium]